MAPRHFWWLYKWKTRNSKGGRKGLATQDRNRLLNWMDQVNGAPPA